MIKILKKRILSNKGFSYVILSVLMVVILLMGVAIFEIILIPRNSKSSIQSEESCNPYITSPQSKP